MHAAVTRDGLLFWIALSAADGILHIQVAATLCCA